MAYRDYYINEGNKIGYMDTEYSQDFVGADAFRIVADTAVTKGRLVEITGVTDKKIKIAHTSAHDDVAIGVAMFDAKAGEEVAVETEGCFLLITGGAITAGTKVYAGADGKIEASSSTASVTNANPVGIALTGATGSNEYVYVKFTI